MVLLSEDYLWKRLNNTPYPSDAIKYLKILGECYNSDLACQTLGVIYRELGDIESASDYFEKAISIKPSSKNYHHVGIYYMHIGERRKGIEYLSKAVDLEPDNPEMLTALGIALSSVKDFDKAEDVLKKALDIDPQNDTALLTLVNLLRYQNRFDDAQKIARKYRGNAPGGI